MPFCHPRFSIFIWNTIVALHAQIAAAEKTLLTLQARRIAELGAAIGLTAPQAERLTITLAEEGYLRGVPHQPIYTGHTLAPLSQITLIDLTDKGKILIGVLPPPDSLEGILTQLGLLLQHTDQTAATPEAAERKRSALRTLIDALAAAGPEIGANLLITALKTGLGM